MQKYIIKKLWIYINQEKIFKNIQGCWRTHRIKTNFSKSKELKELRNIKH